MATGVKLTSQLYLEGPVNLKDVVKKVKTAFSGIKIPIDKFIPTPKALTDAKTKIQSIKPRINVILDIAPGQKRGLTNQLKTVSPKISVTPIINGRGSSSISKAIQAALNAKTYTIKVNPIVSPVKLPSNTSGGGAGTNAKTYKALATSINQASGSIEKFGHDAALAFKRFAAYTVATAGLFALTRALSDSVKEAFEFQHELVRLGQVSKKSIGDLRELSGEVTKLSINYGVSSNELIKVSTTLAQAGYNIRQTKEALETLAKVSLSPTFDGLENATEGLIALNSQFKDIQKTSAGYEKAFNAITAVSAAFAVESEDIVTAVRKTGGVFAAAGGDLNQFIALFTSIRATTRESADSIATGLRTIFTRLQRRQTLEDLKQLGVLLVDNENKFVGSYRAVELLSKALGKIDTKDVQYSQIAELLGGYRQIGKVIPLLQQFKTTQDALQVAQRSQNTLTEDAARASESYLVKIRKVKEEFNALIRSVTGGTAFKTLLDQTLLLTKSLTGLGRALESILPAIGALAALKGISIAATFASGINKGLLAGTFGGLAAGSKGGRTGNPFGGGKSNIVGKLGIGALTAGAITLPSTLSLINDRFKVMDKTTQSVTTSIGLAAAGLLLFNKQLLGNFFGKGAGLKGLGGIRGVVGGLGNPAIARRVGSGVGNAITYGGLAAGIYGSYSQGDSFDKISSGDNSASVRQQYQSGQGTQSAAIGAVTGAQIGLLFSFIPIVGAFAPALGGLIGGIIGYTNSVEQATKDMDKAVSSFNFGKNTEDFDRFIENIRNGEISPNNQQGAIGRRISGLSARQFTATGEDRLTLKNNIQSTLLSFDIFNNALIESSSSLDEFLAKGGDKTLQFASQYTGKSLADLKESIQNSLGIKENEAARKRDAVAREAIILEEQLYIRSLSTAMLDAAEGANNLGSSFDDLRSIVDGGALKFNGRPGFSTLGSSSSISNVNQFRGASQQAIGLLGADPEISNKLLSEVTATATLARDLPSILAEFATGRKSADTDDTAKDFVLSRIVGLPKAITDSLAIGLDSISSDPSGDTPGLIQRITENRNKVSQEILENSGLELSLEILKGASQSFTQQIDILADRLSQVGQREIAVRDKIAENVRSRYSQELTISQLRKITTTPFDAERSSRAQQEALLGRGNRGLAGNSAGIIARIRANRIEQQGVSAQLQNVTDSKLVGPLQKQFKDLQVEATGLEKAFNVLIDNTEKAAIIQDKLSQAQEGSRQVFEGVKSFVFGNLEDRSALERGARLSVFAASQNSVSNIPFNARPEIAQFLDQFSEVRSAAFGRSNTPGERFRSGREVQQDIISSDLQRPFQLGGLGLNKQQADAAAQKIATPREEQFINELATVFRNEQQARSQYEQLISSLPVEFETKATNAFQKFIDDLRANVKVEQDARNKEREDTIKATLGPVQSQIGTYKGLSRFGVSDSLSGKQALSLAERQRQIDKGLSSNKEAKDRLRTADIFNGGGPAIPGSFITAGNGKIINTFVENAVQKTIAKGGYENIDTPQLFSDIYNEINTRSTANGGVTTNLDLADSIIAGLNRQLSVNDVDLNRQKNELKGELSGSSEDVQKLVTSFSGLNEVDFTQVASGINSLSTSLIELQKTAANLSERLRPKEFKSAGGSIFKPRGTDTVPAMLTPGEFVVNRKATKSNRRLLEAVNSGRTMYAAGGGAVGPNTTLEDILGSQEEQLARQNYIDNLKKEQKDRQVRESIANEKYSASINANSRLRSIQLEGSVYGRPNITSLDELDDAKRLNEQIRNRNREQVEQVQAFVGSIANNPLVQGAKTGLHYLGEAAKSGYTTAAGGLSKVFSGALRAGEFLTGNEANAYGSQDVSKLGGRQLEAGINQYDTSRARVAEREKLTSDEDKLIGNKYVSAGRRFIGEAAFDPLNLIGVGGIFKGLKAAGGAGIFADATEKAIYAAKQAGTLVDNTGASTFASEFVESLQVGKDAVKATTQTLGLDAAGRGISRGASAAGAEVKALGSKIGSLGKRTGRPQFVEPTFVPPEGLINARRGGDDIRESLEALTRPDGQFGPRVAESFTASPETKNLDQVLFDTLGVGDRSLYKPNFVLKDTAYPPPALIPQPAQSARLANPNRAFPSAKVKSSASSTDLDNFIKNIQENNVRLGPQVPGDAASLKPSYYEQKAAGAFRSKSKLRPQVVEPKVDAASVLEDVKSQFSSTASRKSGAARIRQTPKPPKARSQGPQLVERRNSTKNINSVQLDYHRKLIESADREIKLANEAIARAKAVRGPVESKPPYNLYENTPNSFKTYASSYSERTLDPLTNLPSLKGRENLDRLKLLSSRKPKVNNPNAKVRNFDVKAVIEAQKEKRKLLQKFREERLAERYKERYKPIELDVDDTKGVAYRENIERAVRPANFGEPRKLTLLERLKNSSLGKKVRGKLTSKEFAETLARRRKIAVAKESSRGTEGVFTPHRIVGARGNEAARNKASSFLSKDFADLRKQYPGLRGLAGDNVAAIGAKELRQYTRHEVYGHLGVLNSKKLSKLRQIQKSAKNFDAYKQSQLAEERYAIGLEVTSGRKKHVAKRFTKAEEQAYLEYYDKDKVRRAHYQNKKPGFSTGGLQTTQKYVGSTKRNGVRPELLRKGSIRGNLNKALEANLEKAEAARQGRITANAIRYRERKARGYNSGGRVTGPSGRDVIPAYLSDGEYVVNKKAAANIGYGNLDRANYLAKGGTAESIYGSKKAEEARERYAKSETKKKIDALNALKRGQGIYKEDGSKFAVPAKKGPGIYQDGNFARANRDDAFKKQAGIYENGKLVSPSSGPTISDQFNFGGKGNARPKRKSSRFEDTSILDEPLAPRKLNGDSGGNKQAALGNLDGLSQALVNFADPATKLAKALKGFKGEISVNFNASPLQVVHGGTVNVAKDIEGIVSTAINNGIRQFIDANMPGLRSASPSKTPMSSDSAIA